MAFPVFVNAAQGSNYSGTNLANLATASITLTAGNLVVVVVRGGACTVADTLGNTYTLRGQGTSAAPLWVFSCANCLPGATTITVTFSPIVNYVSIVAMQFSGAVTTGELISTFTTPLVTAGNTIDLTYNTGGFAGAIVVGIADVFASGSFGFSALTSEAAATGYIEPVADHTSASFFYRLGDNPITTATVRATCTASGSPQKNFLVAVFKSTATGIVDLHVTQETVEILNAPVNPALHVTQYAVESLTSALAPVHITQDLVEVISLGVGPSTTPAWVSQVSVETMILPPPPFVSISQVAVEVMLSQPGISPLKLSQVAVEVMVRPGTAVSGALTGIWVGDGGGSTIWID